MKNGILVIHLIKYLLSVYYITDAKNTPNGHKYCFYILVGNIPIVFLVAICPIS